MVTKVAPIAVQVLLVLFVARQGSLADVGSLALGSATAYLCANFAEVGFGTTLAVPATYYGVERPPLRATRALRLGTALAGSALYVLLWGAGLGNRDPTL